MATLKVVSKDADKLTLEAMQKFVKGRIEIVYLSNGDHLVINEEGLLEGLEPNTEATQLWWDDVGINNVLEHGLPPLVGDILLVEGGLE